MYDFKFQKHLSLADAYGQMSQTFKLQLVKCNLVKHFCINLHIVAQLVKNPPAMQETWVRSLVGKIPWRKERLPTTVFWPGEFHGILHEQHTEQLSLLS